MKRKFFTIFIITILLYGCGQKSQEETTQKEEEISTKVVFLENLKKLCGERIQGEIFIFPNTEPQELHFSFEKCVENEIRMTAQMPNDNLYTIVLTLIGDDLLLKHDVRNKDQSPAEITMFGGFAQAGNTKNQLFPVHNFGGDMWPGYEGYSWEICLNKQDQTFEYIEMSESSIQKHFTARLPGY